MAFWSWLESSRKVEASSEDEVDWPEDEALAKQSSTDPEAFTALYHRYLAPVYQFCYLRLGSQERAEDVTSEVFIRVFNGLAGYRGGKFAAWIFRIAHNAVNDDYNSNRPTSPISETLVDPTPLPEDWTSLGVEHEALAAALAMLPTLQRAVIELQFSDWSDKQIAVALSRSQAAVRMLRLRAMQRLRDILGVSAEAERGYKDEQ